MDYEESIAYYVKDSKCAGQLPLLESLHSTSDGQTPSLDKMICKTHPLAQLDPEVLIYLAVDKDSTIVEIR